MHVSKKPDQERMKASHLNCCLNLRGSLVAQRDCQSRRTMQGRFCLVLSLAYSSLPPEAWSIRVLTQALAAAAQTLHNRQASVQLCVWCCSKCVAAFCLNARSNDHLVFVVAGLLTLSHACRL